MFLQGFIFHLRARNLAPSTIAASAGYLGRFLEGRDPLTVTRSDIENYLAGMYERCKPSSIWTVWRHLKSFFKWLEAEGDITINPMIGVAKPKVPLTEVTVLTPSEIRRLLNTCKQKTQDDKRDLALISIMLDTGLRLSEVTGIKLDDIGEDNAIRVFGKGRKWRTVSLGNSSTVALSRWMRTRGSEPGALWTGRKGALTRDGVRRIINRRGEQAGISLHPHMLRHTFVDNWLRNGGSEVDLARLAGWTSTRMAERYARHRADERAISAHKLIAPLDNLRSS